MKKDVAKSLIGKEVTLLKDNKLGDITAYEKGWFTVAVDDGDDRKVRAKGFVLMDSDDEVVEGEGEGGEVALNPIKEDGKTSSVNASAPLEVGSEITCLCGETFEAPKLESFKCPACGKWHHVRLHPNLNNYIKGLDETPSGRDTVDIDDKVAEALRGMTLENLYDYICASLEEFDPKTRFSKAMARDFKWINDNAAEDDLPEVPCREFLEDRYAELNNGMQRMNIGNLLRGALKRQSEINAVKNTKNEPLDD